MSEYSHIKTHKFAELDSTSDEVQSLLSQGINPPFVVWASKQLKGRGRRGRSWQSGEGNLFLTFALPPHSSKTIEIGLLPIAAAAIVAQWIKSFYSISVRIKWPNDLVFQGRKLGGILCESSIQGKEWGDISIGIGLNLNTAPDNTGLAYRCTSIRGILADDSVFLDVEEARDSFIEYFYSSWLSLDQQKIIAAYSDFALPAGQPVYFCQKKELFLTSGLEIDGSLRLESAVNPGEIIPLSSVNHECEWLYIDYIKSNDLHEEAFGVPNLPFLCLDIGNSLIKIFSFESWKNEFPSFVFAVSPQELPRKKLVELFPTKVLSFLEKMPGWPVYCSSVSPEAYQCAKLFFSDAGVRLIDVEKNPVFYQDGAYELSDLGIDRLALLEGWLRCLSPQERRRNDVLAFVISAGTATTVDVISNEGYHFGGYILPGMQLILDALADSTGLLPEIELRTMTDVLCFKRRIASNTLMAMLDGALLMTVGGIEKIIKEVCSELGKQYRETKVVVTGGNAAFLEKELKGSLCNDLMPSGIRTLCGL
ncbi:MAG: biotin--[acetyl-CoA-carboxylase] ligase [Bdellovibrionota bacterium]